MRDLKLEEVLNTRVKVDETHQVLFAIDSFDQMYEALLEAEQHLLNGKRHG